MNTVCSQTRFNSKQNFKPGKLLNSCFFSTRGLYPSTFVPTVKVIKVSLTLNSSSSSSSLDPKISASSSPVPVAGLDEKQVVYSCQ